jgi:hypothetical protein
MCFRKSTLASSHNATGDVLYLCTPPSLVRKVKDHFYLTIRQDGVHS